MNFDGKVEKCCGKVVMDGERGERKLFLYGKLFFLYTRAGGVYISGKFTYLVNGVDPCHVVTALCRGLSYLL